MKSIQMIAFKALALSGLLVVALSACSAESPLLPGQAHQQSDFGGIQGQEAVPDEFIIKRSGAAYLTSPEEFATANDLLFIREIAGLGVELFKASNPAAIEAVRAQVSSVEPNYLRRISPIQAASQQTLSRLKSQNAVRAASTGSMINNFIGVIGTGINLSDASLQGKLLAGHNTLGQQDLQDDNGYGTQLAKLALSENSQLAGVQAGGKVIPIKAMDRNGIGTDFSVAEGIMLAVEYGAKIIVLGTSASQQSQALSDAIAHAAQQGVTIVDPAGQQAQALRSQNTASRYPAPQQMARPGQPAYYPQSGVQQQAVRQPTQAYPPANGYNAYPPQQTGYAYPPQQKRRGY